MTGRGGQSVRRGWAACVVVAVALLATGRGAGQVLIGPWVEAAQAEAERVRQREVRVIVLEAGGGVVEGARVTATLVSHAFELGVSEPASPTMLQRALAQGIPLNARAEAPPWHDNAADRDRPLPPPIRRGLTGPLIGTDLADWPEAVASLPDAALPTTLFERLERHARPGRRLLPFGDLLQRPGVIDDRLGNGFIRFAHQRLGARHPHTPLGLYAAGGLVGPGQRRMLHAITRSREAVIPFDFVATSYRSSSALPPPRLKIELDRLDALKHPLLVTGVQTGGPTALEAATHAEALLRLLFARPEVAGVYFAALTPDAAIEPHAALLDPSGEASAVGRVVARLFGELWRVRESFTTDAAGNAYARLYHGLYRLDVAYPDGAHATTEFRLEPGPERHRVVVQALQHTDPR